MIVAKMSDIYGRKYVFLLVIAVFVVFSLAAGFAQSFTELYEISFSPRLRK